MNDDLKIKHRIKNLIPDYEYDKYVIGDMDKNSYVQFLPTLKGYHFYHGKICVFTIDGNFDLRKKFRCPTCGNDLMPELKGEKEE